VICPAVLPVVFDRLDKSGDLSGRDIRRAHQPDDLVVLQLLPLALKLRQERLKFRDLRLCPLDFTVDFLDALIYFPYNLLIFYIPSLVMAKYAGFRQRPSLMTSK
jgi:hypothetical protein